MNIGGQNFEADTHITASEARDILRGLAKNEEMDKSRSTAHDI
jgi:hypothetical protein